MCQEVLHGQPRLSGRKGNRRSALVEQQRGLSWGGGDGRRWLCRVRSRRDADRLHRSFEQPHVVSQPQLPGDMGTGWNFRLRSLRAEGGGTGF